MTPPGIPADRQNEVSENALDAMWDWARLNVQRHHEGEGKNFHVFLKEVTVAGLLSMSGGDTPRNVHLKARELAAGFWIGK